MSRFLRRPTPLSTLTTNPTTTTIQPPNNNNKHNSVFKKDALVDLLNESKTPAKFLDFGGEIIPYAAANGLRVQAYGFDDYWEDIGTIRSFFEENLKLASAVSLISSSSAVLSFYVFALLCLYDDDDDGGLL